MANRIQVRRDIGATWSSVNPILAQGEIGLNTTNMKFKIGNGVTPWNSLDYSNSTIPVGGNTGQVLGKLSGNDYDISWVDQSGGGGSTTYTANIGDGVATSYSVVHSMGSSNVVVEVVENSTNEVVYTNVVLSNTNTAVVSFATAPTSNQYKVIVKK